jgi:hypothetical protein
MLVRKSPALNGNLHEGLKSAAHAMLGQAVFDFSSISNELKNQQKKTRKIPQRVY